MKELFRRAVIYILTLESKLVLKKYKPHIVLVTGSVGKTSAKDAAYTALSTGAFVRRSEKNYNGDIGVPLTVLGVPNGWSNPVRWMRNVIDGLFLIILNSPYPTWLIVEVGADRPGDISTSLNWLRPEVVVATRFPAVSVHVEFYDSPREVQLEELAPLTWLRSGGTAVINGDDEIVASAEVPDGAAKIRFGIGEHNDVHAQRVKITSTHGVATGMSFDITHKKERGHVALKGVVGTQSVYATLAGVAAGVAIGMDLEKMCGALSQHEGPKGRMKLIDGKNGSLIIDDSYNSSPIAVEEALKALKDMPIPEPEGRAPRKIVVLGDMLELGSYSVAEHERVGRDAAMVADILVTVGVRARTIAASALKAEVPESNVLQFDKAEDAGRHLAGMVAKGDVVLVKGSQGMRTEKVVKMLMRHPDDAPKLLCRQDAEWLAR